MPDYAQDRTWSDQWIPLLKEKIGPFLLCESSFEQDTKYAADLIVLRGRDKDIACRVRRQKNGYASRFPNQFTIRYKRENGSRTELAKIIDGWGDWFFYGHEHQSDIFPWWIIDLSAFRAHLIRNKDKIRYGKQQNPDGVTHFIWFDITSFPADPPLLIGSQGESTAG